MIGELEKVLQKLRKRKMTERNLDFDRSSTEKYRLFKYAASQ